MAKLLNICIQKYLTTRDKTVANWYGHHYEFAFEGTAFTIIWDFSINIYRTIQANHPVAFTEDRK